MQTQKNVASTFPRINTSASHRTTTSGGFVHHFIGLFMSEARRDTKWLDLVHVSVPLTGKTIKTN